MAEASEGGGGMITEYKALMEAAKVLEEARQSVYMEDRDSPAWSMLDRARRYVLSDAEGILRSES